MPAKVDRCVQDLLKDPKFRPNQNKKTREQSAWAICQASQKKKKNSEADIFSTLYDLPESIAISIDEDGMIELSEIEGMEDHVFEETSDEPGYDLFFDENGMEDESMSGFLVLSEISLASSCKKKKKNEDDEAEDEDSDEYKAAISQLELLRSGTWAHPWYGTIVFDKKYFTSCIQNFANNIIHRDISFDAQHMPWFGAVAWVTKLSMSLRKFFDGKRRWVLKAEVEFTEDGEKMIRQKRFKYFSSEVHDNYKEQEVNDGNTDKLKEYGPTLMGGGVTNRPYISGMLAVQLSEDGLGFRSAKPVTNGAPVKTFTEVVGDEEVSEEEIEKIVTRLDTAIKEKKIDLAETTSRPPESTLPDASFALMNKDKAGNVVKRALSHHKPDVKSHAEDSSVDIRALRKALAQWNQIKGFTPAEIAKAKAHLLAHANEVLKSLDAAPAATPEPETKEEGVGNMDFEQMIKDVQTKLDALDDKDSELAKAYTEQITTIKVAQQKADDEAKAFADDQAKKFEEQQKKIDEQNKALEEQKKKFDEMESRWAVADEERRQAQIRLFCETLEKEDHLPATIEVVKRYMFADVGSFTMKFSEGEGEEKKEVEANIEKMFKDILETIPKERRVKLSENLKGENDDAPVVTTKAEVKLSDKEEPVNIDDPKRRARALSRAGYKVKSADDVQ